MKYVLNDISVDEFNIKTYLCQIEKYDILIRVKNEQLRELEQFSNILGCSQFNNVVSNTNCISDKTGNNAIKKIDLISEIKKDIINYTLKKNDIINDINKLNNSNYVNVLVMKYVELLTLEQIAVRLNYSYDYVRKLHKKAILKLNDIIKRE